MYEIGDTGQGDYVIEPTVPGFNEEDALTVIDLQDIDLERGSLDDVAVALETAMNDLCTMVDFRMKLCTEQAKASPEILNAARAARQRFEKRYRVRSGFVVESIHHSNLVMALEEEAQEENGIFMRMIKAIGNAFKWLWEKVTEFLFGKKKFGDEAEDEKKEKKLRGAVEKFEKRIDEGGKPVGPKVVGSDSLRGLFGFAGSTVGVEKIHNLIETNSHSLDALISTITQSAAAYERLVLISSHQKAIAFDIRETSKNNTAAYTVAAMSMMKRGTKEDHARLGIASDPSDDFTQCALLKDFVQGGEFYAWRQNHSGYHSWTAVYHKPEPKDCKLDEANVKQLWTLIDAVSKLREKIRGSTGKIESTITRAAKSNLHEELTANLLKLLEASTSDEEKADLKKTVENVTEVGSRITKIVKASSIGIDAVNTLINAVDSYILDSVAVDFESTDKNTEKPNA